jgi:hypothetical protein
MNQQPSPQVGARSEPKRKIAVAKVPPVIRLVRQKIPMIQWIN